MPAHRKQPRQITRRLSLRGLIAAFAGFTLVGCQRNTTAAPEGKNMNRDKQGREAAYFDVSTISYIDHPVFEVKLNGTEVGSGGGALMTGVAVPLGPQVVSWRDAGTGETFRATNQPALTRPDSKLTYLGVHIYPDNTVELVPSQFWPERTERGEEILRQRGKRNSQ